MTVGAQGRVVLPAAARAELGLVPGARLSVRVDGTTLVMQKPDDAVRELRSFGARVAGGRSLVDELLAERRDAAASE
ncbi:AbrB/MazE/SpoVT family DNA-binding domain-containing protein [uncultured Friedmanniella sp.]|uniref:AbrB/MazE/SpoVT family DNA-binding domain-containing protein n=1 Tax=uncultured Friedmanniella sp. TaxID=335381 RepID=UPI0035C9DC71